MAQPAARQGDPTAHGGSIVQGDPTVLINGMPAARQGDMHVCPMCNGTVPHGGGPIAQGSSTVLINGQPAARQGDVCTCNGPPDAIAAGDSTVLIGSGGNPVMIGGSGPVKIGGSGPVLLGGGTASGGGGGDGRAGVHGAVASVEAAESLSPEATVRETHWLEFRFEDAAGNPVSGVPYELGDPDGNVSEEWLRGEGRIRRSGLSEGRGEVTLKQVLGAEWSTEEAEVGEEVTVTARAKGFEDGTPATVRIKEVPVEGGPQVAVDEIETEVTGEEVEATWAYTYEATSSRSEDGAKRMPAYGAEIEVEGYPLPSQTGLLTYEDELSIQLRDKETGEPLTGHPYRLRLSTGEIRSGTTDGNGRLKEEDLPPGEAELV